MHRRTFLRSSAVLAAAGAVSLRAADGAAPARKLKKGFMYSTLNSPTAKNLSVDEKFKLLRAAGFHGVEVMSAMNQTEVLAARDAHGLEIPSVVISTHWAKPLTHPSVSERQIGLDGLLHGLRDAKAYGAKSVLLVPGVVNKDVSYADAYARSVAEIRKAVPLAEELGVAIAIENVWNSFLLSPLEAAAYVDQFKSPFVRWHFDVGNIVNSGWPQHWIDVLGSRIAAVHVKEFSRKLAAEKGARAGFQSDLMTGDSDWPAVMAALDRAKYAGWMITEQYRSPNLTDEQYLAEISGKLDRILAL